MPFEVALTAQGVTLQFWPTFRGLVTAPGIARRKRARHRGKWRVKKRRADVLSIPGCVYCIQCPAGISWLWPGQARNLAWNTFSSCPLHRAAATLRAGCAVHRAATERPERSWTLSNMRSTFHNLRRDNTESTRYQRRTALRSLARRCQGATRRSRAENSGDRATEVTHFRFDKDWTSFNLNLWYQKRVTYT